MQEWIGNDVQYREDRPPGYDALAFCAGLNLTLFVCAALMVHQCNPCFALCLPVIYCLAAASIFDSFGDSLENCPYTPRKLLGCLLIALLVLGICLSIP